MTLLDHSLSYDFTDQPATCSANKMVYSLRPLGWLLQAGTYVASYNHMITSHTVSNAPINVMPHYSLEGEGIDHLIYSRYSWDFDNILFIILYRGITTSIDYIDSVPYEAVKY